MVGFGLTVTVTDAVPVQPFTSVPVVAERPVAGLHAYVVPPLAVNDTEDPPQIFAEAGLMEVVGFGLTVTVTVFVLVQPFASVPVIVYVVVVVGLAVTVVPVVAES